MLSRIDLDDKFRRAVLETNSSFVTQSSPMVADSHFGGNILGEQESLQRNRNGSSWFRRPEPLALDFPPLDPQ